MAAKSTAFANALLLHLYNNQAIANLGDASGLQPSGSAGVVDIALHTGAVAAGDAQTVNEAAYTGYSRPSAARSAGGFTVSSNQVSNTAEVDFGTWTAGAQDPATWFSFGYNNIVMHAGPLTASVAIGPGNPDVKAAAGALQATET